MIKIVCNNITLKVEAATLTLVTKNNAFSDSFSLEYSQHPFLIIEDKNTLEALGTRHVLSLLKQKEYRVTVFRGNKVYFGKLKVRSYVTGARKCDLVFGSDLLKILDKPIAEFMPAFYLGDKIPYVKDSKLEISQELLITKVYENQQLGYPDVDFNFPEIRAKDYYKEDDSEWNSYNGYLNRRGVFVSGLFGSILPSELLLLNYLDRGLGTNILKRNFNTYVPTVYLLSILKYCLESIGFKFSGSFTSSIFSKRLSLLSQNTNNYNYLIERADVVFPSVSTFSREIDGGILNPFDIYKYSYSKPLSELGVGTFNLSVLVNDIKVHPFVSREPNGIVFIPNKFKFFVRIVRGSEVLQELFSLHFSFKWPKKYYTIDETLKLIISDENLDASIEVVYANSMNFLPNSDEIKVQLDLEKITQIKYMHSTVDISRHVPDWTFAEFLNNCKNLLNLKIDVDDGVKEVTINYVDNYLNDIQMVDLSNYNLEVKNYKNNQSDVFKLSYANDDFVRIDKEGISEKPVLEKDAVEISNGFLTLPFNGTHHDLSKKNNDDGVVLLLNKPGKKNTTEIVDNKTLNLHGNKGVATTFWKDWVKFRQNASEITLVGEISKLDRIKIEQIKKVYYNNIVFLVEKITTKEKNNFTETVLKVQSKVF